jgi:hypothetical protein
LALLTAVKHAAIVYSRIQATADDRTGCKLPGAASIHGLRLQTSPMLVTPYS